MKLLCGSLLVIALCTTLVRAEETSFRHVKAPNLKGKPVKALLTFSDEHKAIEVRPSKGDLLSIPYAQIDKVSYEYTAELTVALTQSKEHWLKIDYRDQNLPKVFVLQMDKHEYIRILDALKAHTGIDAEILGNADKRGPRWQRKPAE